MQFSVREAKAQFAHVATAAANGERVVITKHGKPFVEIVAVKPPENDFLARLEAARAAAGIKPGDFRLDDEWLAGFNDPAFSRRVLGLED
jgi:prevent-host-death family protein